jgi:hypothetical protein
VQGVQAGRRRQSTEPLLAKPQQCQLGAAAAAAAPTTQTTPGGCCQLPTHHVTPPPPAPLACQAAAQHCCAQAAGRLAKHEVADAARKGGGAGSEGGGEGACEGVTEVGSKGGKQCQGSERCWKRVLEGNEVTHSHTHTLTHSRTCRHAEQAGHRSSCILNNHTTSTHPPVPRSSTSTVATTSSGTAGQYRRRCWRYARDACRHVASRWSGVSWVHAQHVEHVPGPKGGGGQS